MLTNVKGLKLRSLGKDHVVKILTAADEDVEIGCLSLEHLNTLVVNLKGKVTVLQPPRTHPESMTSY
jgi:hypothetical protein